MPLSEITDQSRTVAAVEWAKASWPGSMPRLLFERLEALEERLEAAEQRSGDGRRPS